jgi:hypothetical protein
MSASWGEAAIGENEVRVCALKHQKEKRNMMQDRAGSAPPSFAQRVTLSQSPARRLVRPPNPAQSAARFAAAVKRPPAG